MWEALTGQFPYTEMKLAQLIIRVHTNGERPPLPNDVHPEFLGLMQRAWAHSPDDRPAFPEILKTLDALLNSL